MFKIIWRYLLHLCSVPYLVKPACKSFNLHHLVIFFFFTQAPSAFPEPERTRPLLPLSIISFVLIFFFFKNLPILKDCEVGLQAIRKDKLITCVRITTKYKLIICVRITTKCASCQVSNPGQASLSTCCSSQCSSPCFPKPFPPQSDPYITQPFWLAWAASFGWWLLSWSDLAASHAQPGLFLNLHALRVVMSSFSFILHSLPRTLWVLVHHFHKKKLFCQVTFALFV